MIVAFCNQKGGVGKTTVTALVAGALAQAGARVLVIDADPQGNLTEMLGVKVGPDTITLNDVLAHVANDAGGVGPNLIASAIEVSSWFERLHVVASERSLASREQDVSLGRERRLKVALGTVASVYDAVLIDCPPSMGMLTTNALTAADRVVVVSEARAASLVGVAEMVTSISVVKSHYNPRLVFHRLVLNRFEPNRLDQRANGGFLDEDYGALVAASVIPSREVIARCASERSMLRDGDLVSLFSALGEELVK